MYSFSLLLCAVWIDDERMCEIPRGAGEGRENEDTRLVGTGCDKFLCDQIHTVVQRCDETHIGQAVQRAQLVVRVMLLFERDGVPAVACEFRIDARRFGSDVLIVITVFLDILAARRRYL